MKTICSILLLVASSVLLYSQEQSKPPATHEASVNAIRMLMYTPHRVKVTVEMRETPEQPWEVYSVQTREVAGNRARTIGHIGIQFERIMIGDRSYHRIQDGRWLKVPSDGYTGPTITSVSPLKVEQKVKSADDGKGTVVETTSNRKIIANSTGQPANMSINQKYWLDDSGRVIRSESEHFNFERRKFQRVTEVYEYPLSIQIEEPVTDGKDR